MKPLLSFLRFEVGRLLRNWKFLAITVGFPVVFYALFLHDRSPAKVVDNTVPWRIYLMVSMCSFAALVAGLNAGGSRLSAERASGWARQLRITPIPGWSFVVTKVSATMLVILPVLIPVEIVGASVGGVHLRPGMWVELTVLLWVTALPLAILGVLVGFLVHQETAYPVVTALMFVVGYFGGLFNPVSTMPAALRAVARILPSYHAQSLGLSVLDGRGPAPSDVLVLAGYAVVLGAAVVVHKRWRPSLRRRG